MLRLFFLVLLLANGVYFAWSQGVFQDIGFAPASQAEPERVTQQIRPEALRVVSAAEARRRTDSSGGTRGTECLQTGVFDDPQATVLRQTLEAGWPVGSWEFEPTVEPARWMIYMGRYPDAETVNRKKAELRQRRVLFQNLPTPALEPGLSLGSFDAQDAAERQLAALAERGVRTARVVQERKEMRGQTLRLAAVDDTLRARLDELRTALAGKALRSCR